MFFMTPNQTEFVMNKIKLLRKFIISAFNWFIVVFPIGVVYLMLSTLTHMPSWVSYIFGGCIGVLGTKYNWW